MISALGLQLVSALVSATFLFMIAAGLTLIFGLCGVLHIAHGSVFMLAAFLAYTVTQLGGATLGSFIVAAILIPPVLALLGALLERVLIRRYYGTDLLIQLMPMIAIIYITVDICRFVWGVTPGSVPVLSLFGTVTVSKLTFPAYYMIVMLTSVVVAVGIWILIAKTRWGILVRAASQDRDMTAACGINQRRLATSVFALASGLAGLAGVLAVPISGASLDMDMVAVVNAFIVVVVGGLGSVLGSMVAAIMLGVINAFGILIIPQFEMTFMYALMAIILIVRPTGLFGRE